jgi:hypothetical protein
MVVIENSNCGQMERKKTVTDTEKERSILAKGFQREFAYHAAQFHDQTAVLNRNRANTISAGFPPLARLGAGEPHA